MRRFIIMMILLLLQGCSQTLPTLGGGFDQSEYEGQWLLINYWARWCKPCYEEIPDLNQLDQDEKIKVLGVNFDALNEDQLKQDVEYMGIGFDVLLQDPAGHFDFKTPRVLPVSYLINPNNGHVRVLKGKQAESDLRRAISAAD